MTVKDIILFYIREYKTRIVTNIEIQTVLPTYGKNSFGILHSPETYSREWRRLKAMKKIGITTIEDKGDGEYLCKSI